MNGLLGMGLVGWLVSLVVGFVVGGLFFLSIRVELDYVLRNRGPLWLAPAAIYARLVLVAVVLVLVALLVPGQKVAGAAAGGLIGAMAARVLISRQVKRSSSQGGEDADGG